MLMGFQAHHVAILISSSSKYLDQGLELYHGGGRKVGLKHRLSACVIPSFPLQGPKGPRRAHLHSRQLSVALISKLVLEHTSYRKTGKLCDVPFQGSQHSIRPELEPC